MIDTIVSMTDHDRMVSFIFRLKYSLNNQNPASFTCENNKLPAPTDKTIRLGSTCICDKAGAKMPAAVNPATVADPIQTRIMPAISHPNMSGCTCQFCMLFAIVELTPLS